MRWLRDNWIDALIFTVFAITVVGIVLFLTGVNPFKSNGPIVSPGSGSAPTGSTIEEPAPTEPVVAQPAEESPAPAVTVVPLLPGTEATSNGAAGETTATGESSPAGSQTTSAAASSGNGVASTEIHLPGGSEKGVFRVSVGAFSKPGNALTLAEKLKKQGFPVKLEPVGKVTRVVVGPFSTRSQAAEAARKLSNYEPQVYRGDTPTPEGIYLQVGAYKKISSAENLVNKLRSAGIGPIVFYYQEPWLKVWVGPVAPNKVDELKKQLQDMGLQVVEVR